jgi:Fibronectin type III domain
LTNGTGYTFTVTATNIAGTSAASSVSNPVTPVAVPATMAAPTAVRGDQQATVSFVAPNDNGSPIQGYTVTASPGGATATAPGFGTSATVTGLTNGTAYTFTV